MSYVFMPLGPLIGISWDESQKVAEIIGLKLTANEILAYLELGKLRSAQLITVSIPTFLLVFSSYDNEVH